GIIARKFDTDTVTRYELQRIDGADTAVIRAAAAEIAALFDAGDGVSRVRAIAAYYAMYAEVLPYLRPVPQKRYHTAVSAAMEYIEAHYAEDFSMDTLAAAVCVSESRLYHLFREELRSTPVKYRCAVRIRCAAKELRRGESTLEEIAVRNGFHSAAYFREMFRRETGMTPAAYREMAEEGLETAE
ncbi:MAG: helix-turn-helix transcriptional regulator, partial [Clostridia bacterium]|nr:helix-turn-helix transcriptional regulator [Clostridia bacterium]